ncbi:hypothetical protein [Cloacibacterium sp. TD35]|uniref:hypothetical protein n=1 Tax=Cloacibacterium sp. TD35 TaxID=2976818 RepID=UPI00237E0C71|nr:hypothetical protein [Cloacibacterium sp. TD35]WDT67328.1 hypothetical protein N7277_08295 [Cloacibacterium sp. TD35]
MKKLIILLTILSNSVLWAQSQENNTVNFTFENTAITIPQSSYYNTIQILDIRKQKEDVGFVKYGGQSSKKKLLLSKTIENIFIDYFNQLLPQNSASKNLTFLLRDFYISETPNRANFLLKGAFFSQENDIYYLVSKVEKKISFNSTDKLISLQKHVNNLISTEIKTAMESNTFLMERAFTLNDMISYDDIMKSEIPLYSNNKYPDGIYKSFESLKHLKPDFTIQEIALSPSGIKKIKYKDNSGEIVNAKPITYAIIKDNNIYIKGLNFYGVIKEKNNFYFVGEVIQGPSFGDVLLGTAIGGVGGGIAMSQSTTLTYKYRIDYETGEFVRD